MSEGYRSVCPRHAIMANVVGKYENGQLFVPVPWRDEGEVLVARSDDVGFPILPSIVPALEGIYSATWHHRVFDRDVVAQLIPLRIGNLNLTHSTYALNEIHQGWREPGYLLLYDLPLGPTSHDDAPLGLTSHFRVALDPIRLQPNAWRLVAWNKTDVLSISSSVAGSNAVLFRQLSKSPVQHAIDRRYDNAVRKSFPFTFETAYFEHLAHHCRFVLGIESTPQRYSDYFLGIVHDGIRENHVISDARKHVLEDVETTYDDQGRLMSVKMNLPMDVGPLLGDEVTDLQLTSCGDFVMQSGERSIEIAGMGAPQEAGHIKVNTLPEYIAIANRRIDELLAGAVFEQKRVRIYWRDGDV